MEKMRWIVFIFVFSSLVGCGSMSTGDTTSEQQKSSIPNESSEGTETLEGLAQSDPEDAWRKAYLDYLNTEVAPCAREVSFTFIYLDDDDIPEMFIDTGIEASGQAIIGYYDGEIVEGYFSRIGSQYIEKSGLVYTNTGHMGFYPLDITKYENGKFTVIGSGIACFTDENSPDTLTYEWEGEQVSEETFDSKVAEFYDLEQSRYPDNFKTYNEFVYQIKTGKWTSYDHRYEFIAADTTWDEAQEACKQKGGYLATITCNEEANTIAAQMREQGMESYALFVGFRSSEWVGDTFYVSRWINSDGSYENVMPSRYDFWDYHWPDYAYSEQEWKPERDETDCGLVKYNKETNQIYVFEAPDNLLETSPQYTGKMGYICEYDLQNAQ